jgi:hypothetical protein
MIAGESRQRDCDLPRAEVMLGKLEVTLSTV